MPTITILDESTLGEQRFWDLPLLQETLTISELIEQRVYQEVTEYNARQTGPFLGLIQPTDTERTVNGYQLKTPRLLDWQAQSAQALASFTRHGFIILIDDRQVTELSATITLHAGSTVTFFKLVPLVGG